MQQRRFGDTDLHTSEIAFGTWALGSDWWGKTDDPDRLIGRALELGITFFDTGDAYGQGVNEEIVGRALRQADRDSIQISTKFGYVLDSDRTQHSEGERPQDWSPGHARSALEASLRRLGTDHVDLYQLHRVDPAVPLEETWGAMAEVVAAGKARAIGLSEVTVEEIERARAVHPVASVQSELSLWTRDPLAEVLPYCEEQGIAFLPFSPLGRGFLVGRVSSADQLSENDFRRGLPRFQRDALQANLAIVDRVRQVAERVGATPAQVALAWVLHQGRYVVPIPGTKTPRYLADNARAADLRLGDDDLAQLDALPAPQGARY